MRVIQRSMAQAGAQHDRQFSTGGQTYGEGLLSELARGWRLQQLGVFANAESALGRHLAQAIQRSPQDADLLLAYGTHEMLAACSELADGDEVNADTYWRGLGALRRAAPLDPDNLTLLLTLAHASLLGAEHVVPEGHAKHDDLLRAARTVLRRLESNEEFVGDEEVGELRELLETEFPE